MKPKYLILLLLSFPLVAVEYHSVHEETYWDLSTGQVAGFYSGKVRSNLVWGDTLNFAIQERWCDKPPLLFITHSTTRNIPKGIRENLVDTAMTFDAQLDDDEPKPLEASISGINRIFETTDVVMFTAWVFPEFFLGNPNKVLTLSIPEDSDLYQYFDLPVRQYRMEGFERILIAAHQQCLDAQ